MARLNKKTIAAIYASIKHWEDVYAQDDPALVRIGHDECALCTLFWDDICEGCPIKDVTGKYSCEGTPYNAAYSAKEAWLAKHMVGNASHERTRWKIQARKEINFLKSLLEEAPAHAKPD